MIIGLWVLAALLVLWFNAAVMTSLLDQPLAGLSPQARETITKWQRLEIQISSRLKEALNSQEVDTILAAMDIKRKVKAVFPVTKPKSKPVPAKKFMPAKKKKVVLPELTGIVAIYDGEGRTHYLAVVDGKAREEKSRIDEFLLERIDTAGVLLTREGESWFIAAPRVAYSVTDGYANPGSGSPGSQ